MAHTSINIVFRYNVSAESFIFDDLDVVGHVKNTRIGRIEFLLGFFVTLDESFDFLFRYFVGAFNIIVKLRQVLIQAYF